MSFTKTQQWALAAILLMALALRVWGIGFGLPNATARPDETSVAGPAVQFLSGNFEPPHFLYPTGFMYALSGVYVVYYEVTRPWAAYKTLHDFAESRRQNLAPFLLISRAISVLMGTLTVYWLFLIGARSADRRTGLFAAAMLAVCFLHVRDSHFGVTDATMTAFVVLGVYQVLAWQASGSAGRALIAGIVGGMAMSTKYNGLGVAVPFGVAALDRLIVAIRERRSIVPVLISCAIFAAAFAAVFSAGSFYVFIQPARFLGDIKTQSSYFASDYGLGLPRGWIQHAIVTLPNALGWPMYFAGLAGAAWFLVRDFRRAIVVLAFPLAYYVVAGSGYSVYARYMMPVVPFVCLGAGYAAVRSIEVLMPDARGVRLSAALVALGLLLALPTGTKAIQLDRLLSRIDNRVVVTRALETTLPPDAIVFQTGSPFGRAAWPASIRIHERTFDDATGQFDPTPPDWILIQRSPLVVYSPLPRQLPQILAEQYSLVKTFPAADDRPRLYDQQDAFYLPLAGFDGIERPGPSFDLYRKK
jgi:hypothetical protein